MLQCYATNMLIGHQRNKLVFEKMNKSGNVPHAFLLVGPVGVGKKEFALWCGEVLLGKDPHNHPDVFALNTPNIEEVRNLNQIVGKSSFTRGVRIVIIENTPAMNIQATNALLKTLEEPKSNTIFFLLCETKEQVISTIQSRCVSIHFCFVDLKTIQESLNVEPIMDVQVLWQGRPRLASDLLSSNEFHNKTQEMLQDVQVFLQGKIEVCFPLIEKYTQDKHEFQQFLSAVITLYRHNKQWSKTSDLVGVLYKTRQSNANISWLMRNFVIQHYTV